MTDPQIRKCDKHVFLSGAGFSAAYGAPVMKDFMAVARRRYFPLRERGPHDPLVECYEKMMKFQQECRTCSWAFNRDWDNIEELYTQADLLRLVRHPDALSSQELCHQIAWAIWDVYRDYQMGNHPPMSLVLNKIRDDGSSPAIITTNYDVLCEIGIRGESSEQKYFYPGFGKPSAATRKPTTLLEEDSAVDCEVRNGEDAVPVIKLHGSINWFQYDNGSKLFATTQIGACCLRGTKVVQSAGISGPHFQKKTITAWGNAVCKAISEDPTPAIIPPMLGKMSVSPAIANQWLSAIRCVERAAQITIIGYSFPETDAFMTRLLAEGLKENNGLDTITIVDIQAESEWAGRLERIFAATLRRTKLKYLKSDAREFLNTLAKGGRPKGTAAVYTSAPT